MANQLLVKIKNAAIHLHLYLSQSYQARSSKEVLNASLVTIKYALLYSAFAAVLGAMTTAAMYCTLCLIFGRSLIEKTRWVVNSNFGLNYLPQLLHYAIQVFIPFKQRVAFFIGQIWNRINNYWQQAGDIGKTIFVNIIPLKYFLFIAKFIPIGDWLEFKLLAFFTYNNCLIDAIENKDINRIKAIIAVISKEVYHQYLLSYNFYGNTALTTAACDRKGDPQIFKLLIENIEPSERKNVFYKAKKLTTAFYFYMVGMKKKEYFLEILLQSLPEEDRYPFLLQVDNNGDTILMRYGRYDVLQDCNMVVNHMKYCPPDKIVEYLNTTNINGETALVLFSFSKKMEAFEYLLRLVPPDKMQEYLSFRSQGQKAIIVAHHERRIKKERILAAHGMILPMEFQNLTDEQFKMFRYEKSMCELFKQKHGELPYELLEIDSHCTPEEVKKAFRKKVLTTHPDRNKSANSNDLTNKLTAAKAFYLNPEVRIQYLKPH